MVNRMSKIIKVKIQRSMVDKKGRLQEYEVPWHEGLTALSALNYIFENLDRTLGYYFSCRIGKCNKCLALVNGKTARLCQSPADDDLTLEPLPNHKVIKDLIIEWPKK